MSAPTYHTIDLTVTSNPSIHPSLMTLDEWNAWGRDEYFENLGE